MGQLSIQGETQCLQKAFRDQTVYIALSTATAGAITDSTAIGSASEVTDTGYARVAITFGTPSQNASSATEISNSADVITPVWAANQASAITHALIMDSPTKGAGNILGYHQLATSITPTAGQAVKFAAGQIKLSLE